ncbi:acyl-CoA N-acyltransferase [Multifurca ochricompacta]|uniref:Acyl-CoA N-acyltransferase n=1 Tax=Multifurca ochricompacta TaxID=376703 RepID=A0AAD4M671_9AGAM|nr:acyl-CoA N-acyltransferase [Multifurca ochricompacta]
MRYVNSYNPSERPELHGCYGPDPYDVNWVFPLHESSLKSERVTLTPFIPSIHANELFRQIKAHPGLQHWLPFDILDMDELLAVLELRFRRDPSNILFAIIDHVHGGTLTGTIGLLKASPVHLSVEIGWVFVFPSFQHTHVTSNAVGLLLQYCLELSSTPARPGLGLRRVQWFTHIENKASRRTALRMGLKEEATLRWERTLPEGKVGNGIAVREGDPQSTRPSRHTVVFSLCADDWEKDGKGHVRQLIDRK